MTNTDPAGESPTRGLVAQVATSLRRERQRTGLSLTEVARRAGIAKSTLSQLESGTGNPSLETLWAICVALARAVLPAARPAASAHPGDQGARGPDGRRRAGRLPGHAAHRRPAGGPARRIRIAAEPGHARASQPHSPGVVEHVVISAGRALVGAADEVAELGPGDYICYPGDAPHVSEALEPRTRAVLVSEHPRPKLGRDLLDQRARPA